MITVTMPRARSVTVVNATLDDVRVQLPTLLTSFRIAFIVREDNSANTVEVVDNENNVITTVDGLSSIGIAPNSTGWHITNRYPEGGGGSPHTHPQSEVTNLVSDIAALNGSISGVSASLTAHDADTTSVHGIANTANLLTTATKLDDLAAPDDNTDLNASTAAHGLMPKFPGDTTNFLRADGNFAAPPGGGEADPAQGSYAPGSFTILTGKYAIIAKRLTLTTSQRLTVEGTGTLRGV